MRVKNQQAAYDALATLLRKERLRASLTQATLAAKLDRPQSYVAKYESGERQLDVVEFLLVTRAIGITPTVLLRTLGDRLR